MALDQEHPQHRVYVGRPEAFDLLGGRHFMLLFLLGLREHHTLLDFGCGSLRSGRLLIPYLQPGHYFGIDPNQWLIDDGIEYEIGVSILSVKRPRFDFNADCNLSVFGVTFDFVHVHSVFTHAPRKMIEAFFAELSCVLHPDGLLLATFTEGDEDYSGSGWSYPAQVRYTRATFRFIVESHGLTFRILGFPHTEQTYFLAAKTESRISNALASILNEYGFDLSENEA